ncbi:hypothetical protein BT67DRAFT_436399 [Trichocladium antarcticum]|uniref:Uncharacterized protein n=1 Tax=Trichocladium antarcticum TaxID=1450529 RepID=A0AAN6UDY5_9PEZI|nr:hypothetical protein BT67DRAFT_436399 [Trichocladium antarcticum]
MEGVGLVGCDCHRESVDPGTANDSSTSESDLKHVEYESHVGTNGWYNEIGSAELGTWEVRDRCLNGLLESLTEAIFHVFEVSQNATQVQQRSGTLDCMLVVLQTPSAHLRTTRQPSRSVRGMSLPTLGIAPFSPLPPFFGDRSPTFRIRLVGKKSAYASASYTKRCVRQTIRGPRGSLGTGQVPSRRLGKRRQIASDARRTRRLRRICHDRIMALD